MTRTSMGSHAVVRPASTADVEAIATVCLASRTAAMPYLPRLYDDDETRWWVAHVVMPECQVWVAQESERQQLLGFVAVKDGVLEHLYLLPEHQRRGVGTQLLAQARRTSPERLTLRVFTRNMDARAFYERHGFQPLDDNDGSRNEENEPDMTYGWTKPH